MSLTLIILSLFVFSRDILLKINESILGKLFFVIIIILFAYENTLYGLFVAVIFFVINDKFTYNYYENMVGNIDLSKASQTSGYQEYKIKHNNDMKIKPTTNGIVELSEQLKPLNPRKMELNDNKNNTDTSDIDMINIISQQTSNFEPLMSELDESNLYMNE
tara:strand:- start:509 stop:994 length:486 start_codon:yes stop_codon:yes gene_type:complete